jgi:hypothetical protein
MSTPTAPTSNPIGATTFPANGGGFGPTIEWGMGDTEPIIFQILDDASDPVDITGYDVWFTVKEILSGGALIAKRLSTANGIELTAPAIGIGHILLEEADTRKLEPGRRYFFDIQVQRPTGYIQTIYRGFFVVIPEVTP